jgi:hypothetical protein
MRRKLFTCFSALSSLLCVAVCGLWVRSYWRSDVVAVRLGDVGCVIGSNHGAMAVGWGGVHFGRRRWGYEGEVANENWRESYGLRFGFGLSTYRERLLFVPHAAVTLVSCGATALLFRHGRRRPTAGCCPACGYDLRATPGRCPECGAGPGENLPVSD